MVRWNVQVGHAVCIAGPPPASWACCLHYEAAGCVAGLPSASLFCNAGGTRACMCRQKVLFTNVPVSVHVDELHAHAAQNSSLHACLTSTCLAWT